MTRIIAGSAKGRVLSVARSGTRPTSDRVRESMFSSIGSHLASSGQNWNDVDVLDVYAGTGALGLEALSRGAHRAVLVEKDRSAARVIAKNIEAVKLPGAELVVADAVNMLGRLGTRPFALVFVDPPYTVPASVIIGVLGDGLAHAGLLEPSGLVVVERPVGEGITPFPAVWEVMGHRRHGDTALWYGHPSGLERS